MAGVALRIRVSSPHATKAPELRARSLTVDMESQASVALPGTLAIALALCAADVHTQGLQRCTWCL